MFFFLSKTLNYLVMPLTIVVGCLVLSLLIRNQKWQKRLRWIGVCLIVFFSNPFIANELMKAWEVDTPAFSDMRRYKLGIVLTGTMIPELKFHKRFSFFNYETCYDCNSTALKDSICPFAGNYFTTHPGDFLKCPHGSASFTWDNTVTKEKF